MGITLEKALNTIKANGTLPYIVNVNNVDDYRALISGIIPTYTIRISDYFKGGLPFPNENEVMTDIAKVQNNTFVFGFAQYLAFKGGKEKLREHLGAIAQMNTRIIVVCYQIESVLDEMVKNDKRIKNRVIFVSGVADAAPTLTLSAFDIKGDRIFANLKAYFKSTEDNGGISAIVTVGKTKISELAFKNGIRKVDKPTSAYTLLTIKDASYQARLAEAFGTTKEWEWLLNELNVATLKEICKRQLGGIDLSEAAKGYFALSPIQKWLLVLAIKMNTGTGYISFAAGKATGVSDFVASIYNSILDIAANDKKYGEYYQERKGLIKGINDLSATTQFCNLADIKDKDKIKYLTDTTELERKETIKCITKYEYTLAELKDILAVVYPLLADYLAPYFFDIPLLDSYFEDYKLQKICNSISDDFKAKVLENAEHREKWFEALLPRSKELAAIDMSNTSLKWIDALGAEFAGFIVRRATAYNLRATIHVARANLPTLTEFNKEFFDESRGDKKISEIDEIKHKGEGDYDFSKTTLPLYITKELEIIDDVIRKAQADISTTGKVVIVSDHGATRLARISDNILTVDAEVDGAHGGRCCHWVDGIEKVSKYVTDTDNNGYCCIANYDRFKGGKFTGVELHGGASLEEVVVPIIVLSRRIVNITYQLAKHTLTLTRGKTEPLVITLSTPVGMPRLRIGDKFGLLLSKEDTKYTFDTGITKTGKYTAAFLDDNQEVVTGIAFEAKSAIGGMNDIL